MTVLVTGAAGLIGSRIVALLRDRDIRVIALDKVAAKGPSTNEECVWVEGDICDKEGISKLLKTYSVSRLIHCASVLQADCQRAPYVGMSVNVGGTLNVLEAASGRGVERVVFTSSMAVYGGTVIDPMPETHPCNPKSLYGTAKLLGEQLGTVYSSQGKLQFIALRYGLVYGPGRVASAGVASKFQNLVRGALEEGVIRLPRSNPRKPFLFAGDAAAAAVHPCFSGSVASGIFNISGDGHSMEEVGQFLGEMCPGAQRVYDDEPMLPGEVNGFLDITRARTELGFSPQVSMRQGLALVSEHIRKQASSS